jgi:hypothetical protein
MTDLVGPPPEIAFTLTIKRAATGLEEHYQMVGHVLPQPTQSEKEQDNGCNPLDCGA